MFLLNSSYRNVNRSISGWSSNKTCQLYSEKELNSMELKNQPKDRKIVKEYMILFFYKNSIKMQLMNFWLRSTAKVLF